MYILQMESERVLIMLSWWGAEGPSGRWYPESLEEDLKAWKSLVVSDDSKDVVLESIYSLIFQFYLQMLLLNKSVHAKLRRVTNVLGSSH